jgi:hypothetical protein
MKIEAVIVCVNFSDILDYTLGWAAQEVDRVVVVTSSDDKATQAVCEKVGVECVVSDRYKGRGVKFDKGAMVNDGLAVLERDGWVLLMDCDIMLPYAFKKGLDTKGLRIDTLYGVRRIDVVGARDILQAVACGWASKLIWEVPPRPDMGVTFIGGVEGVVPIGFFQLFHSEAFRLYPEGHKTAGESDVLFACGWDAEHRVVWDDAYVLHLSTQKKPMGLDWGGRMSCRLC